jgi:hypothetical protein
VESNLPKDELNRLRLLRQMVSGYFTEPTLARYTDIKTLLSELKTSTPTITSDDELQTLRERNALLEELILNAVPYMTDAKPFIALKKAVKIL